MKKYFWREKNANNYIGKCNIVVPTSDELFKEIIKKFEEKLEMIDVIFDKIKKMNICLRKIRPFQKERQNKIRDLNGGRSGTRSGFPKNQEIFRAQPWTH